ncbi:MAG: hypothetical protein M1484_01050 [Patescibacteria group bacterium]|nr:hypothetical protein [Patescibacteria group bacterium]MCL5431667.1 hypothetical protein [Patescibacteria group bacterium]
MGYEVDQSIKIEQTERDTVIAVANGSKFSIMLRAKEKRLLQKMFRDLGKPDLFVYFTFAALLAIVFNKMRPKSAVVIDNEYVGHEDVIKLKIKQFSEKLGCDVSELVTFGLVGKKSPAHLLAASVTDKVKRPDLAIEVCDVWKLINLKPNKNDRVSRSGPRAV